MLWVPRCAAPRGGSARARTWWRGGVCGALFGCTHPLDHVARLLLAISLNSFPVFRAAWLFDHALGAPMRGASRRVRAGSDMVARRCEIVLPHEAVKFSRIITLDRSSIILSWSCFAACFSLVVMLRNVSVSIRKCQKCNGSSVCQRRRNASELEHTFDGAK